VRWAAAVRNSAGDRAIPSGVAPMIGKMIAEKITHIGRFEEPFLHI
jgi:hypothetical protein